MFTDTWWMAAIAEAKNNYSITIGLVLTFFGCIFKTIAIRHPAIKDNKIITLWKSWIFGLPVIGAALSKEKTNEGGPLSRE